MSVKTMGQVWDLDNEIIDREEKYVLLAYADHADHDGNNMFPSIDLICKKTGYKERSIQNITRALEEKGFLVADGKGPRGTNKWSYGGGANFAGVQKTTEGGAKVTVEGVQTVAPESLRTTKEPSTQKPDLFDAMFEAGKKGQLVKDAQIAFEAAFGFGTLPWDSKNDWQKFSRWVCSTHQTDPRAFVDYVQWRNEEGKYKGAMTNTAIRRDPQIFMDTGYPTFLAHTAMYGNKKSQPVTTPEGGMYV